MTDQQLFLVLVLLLLGGALGYFLRQFLVSKRAKAVEQIIKKQLEEAKSKATDLVLKAKEKAAS